MASKRKEIIISIITVLIAATAVSIAVMFFWPQGEEEPVYEWEDWSCLRENAYYPEQIEETDTIDTSNVEKGYVTVQNTSSVKVAFIVDYINNDQQNQQIYFLEPGKELQNLPLANGNGRYEITYYENIKGNHYSLISTIEVETTSEDNDTTYVMPNIVCSYQETSEVVKIATDLADISVCQKEYVSLARTWISENIEYDHEKAASNKPFVYPDHDEILKTKKGICIDTASLLAAMLRSQGIATKIVVGYVDDEDMLHAWNEVYVDGKWEIVAVDNSQFKTVREITKYY